MNTDTTNSDMNPKQRHCTFSFFDQHVEVMLFGNDDTKIEEHELELMILKLWNMQSTMKDIVGMELAQA